MKRKNPTPVTDSGVGWPSKIWLFPLRRGPGIPLGPLAFSQMRDLRASRQRAQDALERLRVDLGLERRVFIFTNPKYAIQLGFSVTGTVAA